MAENLRHFFSEKFQISKYKGRELLKQNGKKRNY